MNALIVTKGSRSVRFRVCMAFAVWVGCLGLCPPECALSDEQSEKACAKDETRTDEGCVRNPKITHKTPPVYPSEAKKHGVEGSVILQVRLTKSGEIETLEVIKAQATDSSYVPMFTHAATEAVRKWRYSPGTLDGKPRAVAFTTRVDFHLQR